MFQRTIGVLDQKIVFIRDMIAIIIAVFLSLSLFANNTLANWSMPPPPVGAPANFDSAILNLTNWILGFVAMIAVLAIIWGGVSYIGSAGDETKATTGKRVITYALLGLVVAGIAYAIVNVIVSVILV